MREIAAALAEELENLLESTAKAFKHWPAISESLDNLFDRAPREAIVEPEAVLARMAIDEVSKGGYPESGAAVVRERAERVLAECGERSRVLVEKAIEEPNRLVKAIDEFVALFGSADHRFAVDEAAKHSCAFLDNCRRLDRALSDIPRRLRGGEGA